MLDKLKKIVSEFDDLGGKLSDPAVMNDIKEYQVWDEKDKRWDVDDFDPHEIKLLQEKATETMALARAETEAAIKAKSEAEALMAATSQAEERIQKPKQEEEESLKVKEEAIIEVANAKAEVEELKRLLEKTQQEMENEKANAVPNILNREPTQFELR